MTLWKTAASRRRKTSRCPDRKQDHAITPGRFAGVYSSRLIGDRRDQEIAGRSARARLADVALERPLAAGKQPQRIGIDAVLDLEDALRQRVGAVVIADRDRALHQDRAGIGL